MIVQHACQHLLLTTLAIFFWHLSSTHEWTASAVSAPDGLLRRDSVYSRPPSPFNMLENGKPERLSYAQAVHLVQQRSNEAAPETASRPPSRLKHLKEKLSLRRTLSKLTRRSSDVDLEDENELSRPASRASIAKPSRGASDPMTSRSDTTATDYFFQRARANSMNALARSPPPLAEEAPAQHIRRVASFGAGALLQGDVCPVNLSPSELTPPLITAFSDVQWVEPEEEDSAVCPSMAHSDHATSSEEESGFAFSTTPPSDFSHASSGSTTPTSRSRSRANTASTMSSHRSTEKPKQTLLRPLLGMSKVHDATRREETMSVLTGETAVDPLFVPAIRHASRYPIPAMPTTSTATIWSPEASIALHVDDFPSRRAWFDAALELVQSPSTLAEAHMASKLPSVFSHALQDDRSLEALQFGAEATLDVLLGLIRDWAVHRRMKVQDRMGPFMNNALDARQQLFASLALDDPFARHEFNQYQNNVLHLLAVIFEGKQMHVGDYSIEKFLFAPKETPNRVKHVALAKGLTGDLLQRQQNVFKQMQESLIRFQMDVDQWRSLLGLQRVILALHKHVGGGKKLNSESIIYMTEETVKQLRAEEDHAFKHLMPAKRVFSAVKDGIIFEVDEDVELGLRLVRAFTLPLKKTAGALERAYLKAAETHHASVLRILDQFDDLTPVANFYYGLYLLTVQAAHTTMVNA